MADIRERRISLTYQFHNFDKQNKVDDDGLFTFSSIEQKRVEDLVEERVEEFNEKAKEEPILPKLFTEEHKAFLMKGLFQLPSGYESLDASRPWVVYWILHSLELLHDKIPTDISKSVVSFLNKCQNPTGGYGGGPGQISHLATTYAAVMALCIIGTEEAFNSINRPLLYQFLRKMKRSDGGFTMHQDGEIDIRGAYCAAAVASITNISNEDLFDRTAQWVVSCQTYEGGFAAFPFCEAHGGYTFCGLATLILLGHERLFDSKSISRWLSYKQMRFEGGFQGRTNKLVDSCYSYWQGAAFPLLHQVLHKHGDKALSSERWMFDVEALQNYILLCCQNSSGGLMDKPDKPRDYYHTCYALSGLSLAQYFAGSSNGKTHIVGPKGNLLQRNHHIFNITLMAESTAREYFLKLPSE